MNTKLQFDIQQQPDDATCGPTCLHAVYAYYGDCVDLAKVIQETPKLAGGGTLASLLAGHALRRGYATTLYSFNLRVFDPTWAKLPTGQLLAKLTGRLACSRSERRKRAVQAYMDVLEHGGRILFDDLSADLIERFLTQSKPILTGLSATYLYQCSRELDGAKLEFDDVRGEPQGHFVVLCGYDERTREVLVADPLEPNPVNKDHFYSIPIDRVLCAILLGVLTYDGNLLLIEPKPERAN
jgi:hypothetical protein